MRFLWLAPLALSIGCEQTGASGPPAPPAPPAIVLEKPKPAPEPKKDEPALLGKFQITFYYMIGEDEAVATKAPANDNAALASQVPSEDKTVTLYDPDHCDAIADVSPTFASQLALQGTGKLADGRVLNIWGPRCQCDHSPCFKVAKNKWGNAGTNRPLQPFRTVAVDPKVVKLGSLLYVPLLEGRRMPGREPWGGFVHDGCVVADDTGGFAGAKIDLFVGRKAYFLGLSGSQTRHAWANQVPVFDGAGICERKGHKVARKTGSI
jgi:3D (Asp-Asp-Asp) domain-containing protein